MSQFTLVILDDTHYILKVGPGVSPRNVDAIREAWDKWKQDGGLLMVHQDMDVINGREVTIDLVLPEERP